MNIPSTWQENISALRICPCQSAPVVEQRRNPIHTINENQEVGSRIQEQPEGLQHLGLASGRRDEDLEGGAAVAAAAAAAAHHYPPVSQYPVSCAATYSTDL